MPKPVRERPVADVLPLLRGVSRSFFLSIRLLPPALRGPVGLAYLLARAADTLADTASVPVAQRTTALALLQSAIASGTADADLIAAARTFAASQEDAHERKLIEALPRCIEALHAVPDEDRASIRTVLGHITRGQALDLQRFGVPATVRALDDAAQLEEYTYLVAGCVGEFWTELCARHLPAFANESPQQMREWGRAYGSALQLVNILRDAGADLRAGRCYLPAQELAALGVRPEDVLAQPHRIAPVWLAWRTQAGERLALGLRYAQAVRGARVRAASALPALLGARTLALLDAAGPAELERPVKMARSEVRGVLLRLALQCARPAALRAEFARLGAAAGPGGWDNRAR